METRREGWVRRVAEWRRSGLTAKEFAGEIGVKPMTLSHWAWQLGREQRLRRTKRGRLAAAAERAAPGLIEVVGVESGDSRFELELSGGRRLRIPSGFESSALERLLGVLEKAR
jgi:transposase